MTTQVTRLRRLSLLFEQATNLLERLVFIEVARAQARPTHVAHATSALPPEPAEECYHEEHLASFLNAGHVIRTNRQGHIVLGVSRGCHGPK